MSDEGTNNSPSGPLQSQRTLITQNSDSTSSATSDIQNSSNSNASRKRRVPNSITPNACTNCKRARSKCDGGRPACRRCTHRSMQDSCVYEVHAKVAKDLMLNEIRRLQQKNEDLEEQQNSFAEKHAWVEQIIRSLSADGQCADIVYRLKRNESPSSIARALGRPLNDSPEPASTESETRLAAAIERYHRDLVETQDPRFWTSTTNDPALIEHLIKLYMTWIHPLHTLFDEDHFVESFQSCTDVYCSPALVNACCAMSCHVLSQNAEERDRVAILSLRMRFMDESRNLMKNAPPSKMTSIQTWAVMFLVELGSGDGIMASSHLRLACELLTAKRNAEQSAEATEISTWGIMTLFTSWCAFLYMKPTVALSPKQDVFRDTPLSDGLGWSDYRHPGDIGLEQRSGYVTVAACELAKLNRIVQESVILYCGNYGKLNAHRLVGVWSKFKEWREELPHDLCELDEDKKPLPHVLSLRIQYQTALINIFKPLLFQDHTSDSTRATISRLLIAHAKEGLAHLVTFCRLYSAFYLSPIQLFCLVHICDAIITHDTHGPSTQDTIRFCMESLQEAKLSYPLAGPLQRMFSMAVNECDILLPDNLQRFLGPATAYQMDELLSATTRLTYRAPINQLLPNMEPSLAEDFVEEWRRVASEGIGGELESPTSATRQDTQRSMHINALLNDD